MYNCLYVCLNLVYIKNQMCQQNFSDLIDLINLWLICIDPREIADYKLTDTSINKISLKLSNLEFNVKSKNKFNHGFTGRQSEIYLNDG